MPPLLRQCKQLEIKAYLEAVYGLKVERVATINYLGKKHLIPVTVPGSYKVRQMLGALHFGVVRALWGHRVQQRPQMGTSWP